MLTPRRYLDSFPLQGAGISSFYLRCGYIPWQTYSTCYLPPHKRLGQPHGVTEFSALKLHHQQIPKSLAMKTDGTLLERSSIAKTEKLLKWSPGVILPCTTALWNMDQKEINSSSPIIPLFWDDGLRLHPTHQQQQSCPRNTLTPRIKLRCAEC